jgi:hypothetical protein
MNTRNLIAAVLMLIPMGAQAQDTACPSAATLGMKADSATSPAYAVPMTTGAPVAASLHYVDRIFFAVPPRDRAIARTYGGTFALEIAQAGTWRVALDVEAALDLVQAGRRVAPLSAGAVDGGCFVQQARYSLRPGRYLLQLSSSRLPVHSLLVEKTKNERP